MCTTAFWWGGINLLLLLASLQHTHSEVNELDDLPDELPDSGE